MTRFIPKPIMDLVQRFIKDCNIGADQYLFPDAYKSYVERLKALAKASEVRALGVRSVVIVPVVTFDAVI